MTTVNTLFSGGQGVAVPSGLISNIQTSTNSSNLTQSSPVNGTWYYLAGSPSLTLSSGTYLILSYGLLEIYGSFTSTNWAYAFLRIRNTTDSTTVAQSSSSYGQNATTYNGGGVNALGTIQIPSGTTKTLQMQILANIAQGSPTLNSMSLLGGVNTSILSAIQIA